MYTVLQLNFLLTMVYIRMTYLHKVAFPPAAFSSLLLEVKFKPKGVKIMFVLHVSS